MKKQIMLALAIVMVFGSCNKDQAVKTSYKPGVQKKSPDPKTSALFMSYVGVMRHGDQTKHRFSDFPDVPLEEANELFDNIFAVFIPLREEQTGGMLVEYTLKVTPETLQIISDSTSSSGYSYYGPSVAVFLTHAIDEVVDYVNGLDVSGYKYISYIYSTPDDNNQYDIHFGLVNNDENYEYDEPEGEPGDLTCQTEVGTYNPATSALGRMSYMLNAEVCNPNLRAQFRAGSNAWPPDPRLLGQLAPCTDVVLVYAGNQSENIDYQNHDWAYDESNFRRNLWSEDLPLGSSINQTTPINQNQLHFYGSSIGIYARNSNFFPWVDNYWDPVGYSQLGVSNVLVGQNTIKYFHTVRFAWQQLRWVGIPDPDCWGFNIATTGVTTEINP